MPLSDGKVPLKLGYVPLEDELKPPNGGKVPLKLGYVPFNGAVPLYESVPLNEVGNGEVPLNEGGKGEVPLDEGGNGEVPLNESVPLKVGGKVEFMPAGGPVVLLEPPAPTIEA